MRKKEDLFVNLMAGLIAGCAILSIVAVVIFFAAWAEGKKCAARWGERGHYAMLTGCMVDTKDGLVPQSAIRVIE